MFVCRLVQLAFTCKTLALHACLVPKTAQHALVHPIALNALLTFSSPFSINFVLLPAPSRNIQIPENALHANLHA